MSFSYNVKREIAQKFGNARHCNIAELAAILNMCAYIGRFRQKFYIKLRIGTWKSKDNCDKMIKRRAAMIVRKAYHLREGEERTCRQPLFLTRAD